MQTNKKKIYIRRSDPKYECQVSKFDIKSSMFRDFNSSNKQTNKMSVCQNSFISFFIIMNR